jgi:hypothetical protein
MWHRTMLTLIAFHGSGPIVKHPFGNSLSLTNRVIALEGIAYVDVSQVVHGKIPFFAEFDVRNEST